jgi:eukaryotic-like serine/threonine-protein kinase
MSSADPARWAQVGEAFDRIVELDPAAQRAALDALAGDDPALAAEVESLIAADAQADGLLEHREEALAPIAADQRPDLGGGWRVIEAIGRGGMGEVWLAESLGGGVGRRAAVKLLKRGMDSEALLERFLQERRILARLSHPAIASMLDAGITPDGRPFLAMEYIRGEPITAHARRAGLGLTARIRLLAEVADAVDHAHRQLVVHRDLKPGNVLVDEEGKPHLLDFGIAKVLGEDTDQLVVTATGVRVLSPAYAAPEQVRGEDVSVAADVYGLGVLLYELLTGRLPHQRSGRVERLAQEISEERALRPSSAASDAAMAQQAPWARRLAGDLDTILLKAIHPEPERRYASATALADDLRRYLSGRPIHARPESGWYRFGKFLSRHRLAAVVTVASLALLLGTLGWSLGQSRQAQAEAAAARVLLRQQELTLARTELRSAALARALDELTDSDARGSPGARARAWLRVATALADAGKLDSARRALQVSRRQAGANVDPEFERAHDQLEMRLARR